MKLNSPKLEYLNRIILNTSHVIVLILSLFLIISISIDTFNDIPFQSESSYLKVQLWICMFFLFVFFIELLNADKKWKYLGTHMIFFVISIPYLNIIDYYNINVSYEANYFIRFIPLVRGGYALALIVGRFTKSKATSIFVSYLTMLLANVYFASLLFYAVESKVNPEVTSYSLSLWWAFMNVTTVGSNIYAVTTVGRVTTVVLAALGMMMFPVFTVYVTSLIQKVNGKGAPVS